MKITVYTVTDCQFSKQEKEYLTSHNLQFEEKNLETNKDFLTEMLAVSENFAGTPVTRVEKDNGEITVLKGFTQSEFDQAFRFTPADKQTEPQTEPPKVETTPPASTPVNPAPDVNTPPNPTPEPQNPPAPEPPIVPVVEPPPQSIPTSPQPPSLSDTSQSTPQASATQPLPAVASAKEGQDERLSSVLDNLQSMSANPPSTPNQVTPANPTSSNMPSVPDLKLG